MNQTRPPITVSEAARILGLSADRVRQLERVGILPSLRTSAGWRLFDRSIIERIAAERASAERALERRVR